MANPKWEDTKEVMEEVPKFEDTKEVEGVDPLLNQVGTTTAGVAAGSLGKVGANVTSDLISKAANSTAVRSIPVLGDFTGGASYALKGERVVGQKALNSILDESLKEGRNLKEMFKTQKKTASKKIGKTLELLDKKVPAKNYNQYLNKLQASLKSLSPATEDAQKTKKELQIALDNYKEMKKDYSVSKSKNVKTGLEDATERLETLKQRLISESEELGETKTFSPNKVDETSKRVSTVDLQDGKVRSVPIKSGEYTPIKISNSTREYFSKLKPSQLKDLETSLREVVQTADPKTRAFAQAVESQNVIRELLNEQIESTLKSEGLERYENANRQYRSALEAEKVIPSLFKGELGEIQTADFLRKIGDSNMAGDKKQQIFNAVMDKLENQPPEVVERMRSVIETLSDKYELSDRTRRQGSIMNIARNLGVRLGDATGSSMRIPKKVAGAVIDKLPIIGGIAGAALSYDTARAEGLDRTDAAIEAVKQEGVETALGMGSLLMPDGTGPRRGTVEYKLERGEKLEPYEYKQLMEKQNQNLAKMSQNLLESENQGKQYFGQQLQNIESSEDKEEADKQMFSLLQQPAFRKILKDETKSETGNYRSPDSIEKIVEREGSAASVTGGFVPYQGLTGPKNTRVEGSTSDYGLYYDSEGKLTGGIGDLITSEEEKEEKFNSTKEEAESYLQPNIDANNRNMKSDLEQSGVDVESLPPNIQDALENAAFQLGSFAEFTRLKKALKDGLETGNYDNAVIESFTSKGMGSAPSEWVQQSPVRVRDFVESINPSKEAYEAFNEYNQDDRFDFSQEEIDALQKAKDREAKQLGSGAMGDQRSSLDDLMGQLEASKLDTVSKGEMQQAAYNGDMQKLQELIDRLRQ